MAFGVPYQGSKNIIAKWVCEHIPECDCLVDVFAGGCAVTDAFLSTRAGARVVANDLNPIGVQLYNEALLGEYAAKPTWVSREEFHRLKSISPYVALCWSFSSNRKTYMYSQEREILCHAAHRAVVDSDFSELSSINPDLAEQFERASADIPDIKHKHWVFAAMAQGKIDHIDHLDRWERLRTKLDIEKVSRLTIFTCDYRELTLPDKAVIYCDPPYLNTENYGVQFDTQSFLDWAVEVGKSHRILISEYAIDDPRFISVAERYRRSTFGAGRIPRTERLFTVKGGLL